MPYLFSIQMKIKSGFHKNQLTFTVIISIHGCNCRVNQHFVHGLMHHSDIFSEQSEWICNSLATSCIFLT